MTLEEIAAELRRHYPDAVRVQMSVTHEGHQIDAEYKPLATAEKGSTYRCLDGKWSDRREG